MNEKEELEVGLEGENLFDEPEGFYKDPVTEPKWETFERKNAKEGK